MKSKACIMTFRPFNIPAVYSDDMLARLAEEFDMLRKQCENKEAEIAAYKNYLVLLESNLKTLK